MIRGTEQNYRNITITGKLVRVNRWGIIIKSENGEEIGWLNYSYRMVTRKFNYDDLGKNIIVEMDNRGYIKSWYEDRIMVDDEPPPYPDEIEVKGGIK